MFIFDMKVNSKLFLKIFFAILFAVILIIFFLGLYKIFFSNKNKVDDNIKVNDVTQISSNNYTNILKEVHNNLDNYVGKKIKFTGFVYRLYDFSDNQFVLAREMLVSSNYQAVVVGFLCNLNEASKYSNGTWIEIEGTITKGDYHGEIPVINIYKIQEVPIPSDEYVYPPDNSYINTINLI